MFTLKIYQQKALKTLEAYFRDCAQTDDPDMSFYKISRDVFGTGITYRSVKELPGLPYVCIRIPTGGGKTLVACYATSLAARDLLRTDRCVVLWLVPSNAIKEQTIKALKDRQHPYRLALDSSFGSTAVMDTSEALYITPSAVNTETTIIVSTLQAFRVDDTEGRKVYEEAGSLLAHFSDIPPEVRPKLKARQDGSTIPSLENVLRLHRPIVVVDEAHNARTSLSFETLSRFNPSCIIEFTATPDTDENPSNVLHSVSAAELQAEDMIKMPIRLETRTNWKELLSDAVGGLNQLESVARKEQQETGEYLRPIMLLQAQPRRHDQPTLTVEVVKECLLNDHRIPEGHIAITTGTKWELENVDLSAPTCPVKYIITVQALREGWDCPFAYILCSVAEQRSATAVEQILGRVMRLPQVKKKAHEELNMAYAFVASANFATAANELTDALVENGFNRQEAADFITQVPPPLQELPLFASQTVALPLQSRPTLEQLPQELAAKISYDRQSRTLTYTGVMGDEDRDLLTSCVSDIGSKSAIERAYRQSHGWRVIESTTPAERGETFSVPVLAVKRGQQLEVFEETHFLEHSWNLGSVNASVNESEFPSQREHGKLGEIKIGEDGRVTARFVSDLQEQMTLIAGDQWNVGQLLNWLEHNIPHPDIEPEDFGHFLQRLVRDLLDGRGLSLDYLVLNKYKLRQAVETKVAFHRHNARVAAYQLMLVKDSTSPLVVTPDKCFTYSPNAYPYSLMYRGAYEFRRHYYKAVGDLKAEGEEFECAQFLDSLPEIRYFARNPSGNPVHAFWLQTSSDRFYPDFVCQLNDGRYLVVEYKSERDWTNDDSKEKRDLGELWEARSGGKCLFIMPKGRNLASIKAKIMF